MSEVDPVQVEAAFAQIDAMLLELRARLARQSRQSPDVPLHRRGLGVMDEPPATDLALYPRRRLVRRVVG